MSFSMTALNVDSYENIIGEIVTSHLTSQVSVYTNSPYAITDCL
jgi:hypothetical protein